MKIQGRVMLLFLTFNIHTMAIPQSICYLQLAIEKISEPRYVLVSIEGLSLYCALGVRKATGFSQFAQKLGKSSLPNFVNFLVTLRPNMMIFFNNI